MTRVLIVEDQPAIARALRVLFDLNEMESVAADTPEAALRHLERGDVGVVLQDMNFSPGQTSGDEGVALFRRIREAAPDVPILLMTAWTSLETAVKLVKEGATDYLAKPWDDEKLVETIRSLLRIREMAEVEAAADRNRTRSRDALAAKHDLCGIIYSSELMHRVVSTATQIGPSDVPVLITGPNGAGKEKVAEIIHASSRRRRKPLVKVNVGAIPDELMESELFGAEPGAYTGLTRMRVGRFEAADGGTLFLDEIGNLSPAGQVKLLRVLQTGEYERLGSSTTRKSDVRVVCATNADLHQSIARGSFRQDLYFRIAVMEIEVPPLNLRREDVVPLAKSFAEGRELSEGAIASLLSYEWPGNVRELQNRVKRAVAVARGDALTAEDLGFEADAARRQEEMPIERAEIELAILNAGGSVSRAAGALGLSRQALYRRMEKLGIVLERRPR